MLGVAPVPIAYSFGAPLIDRGRWVRTTNTPANRLPSLFGYLMNNFLIKHLPRHEFVPLVLLLLAAAPPLSVADDATVGSDSATASVVTSAPLSYSRDIRPILSDNCFACHGFDKNAREADLRLDSRQGAVDDGGVIDAGDSESSSLIERITSTDPKELMPPADSGHQLSAQQIQMLRRWIDEGAVYETHWAFVAPIRDSSLTEPGNARGENANPIDRLVQARLAAIGIEQSPPAGVATLIRRVSLDLTGLPPSVAEIAAFEAASAIDSEAAYSALVERLLSSDHYGERWARWWLDQARYADSHGYSVDGPREIWLFRDWVIKALNDDMPFDQFTIEQLAGDLLPDATDWQKVGTGFHRNTQINQEGGIDKEQFRIDSVIDRVGTTGTVWLGLTVGCAQCHDHKFDPLTQKDFYQLFAFLNNQDEPSLTVYPNDVDADELKAQQKRLQSEQQAMIERTADQVSGWESSLDDPAKQALSAAALKTLSIDATKRNRNQRWDLLKNSGILTDGRAGDSVDAAQTIDQQLSSLSTELSKGVSTMVLADRSTPRETTILIKGDFTRPSDVVQPGTPTVLPRLQPESELATRLDLARWIVSPENPLTARVISNRIWQQYFGRGLVQTDNDFGLQGTSPTHPQLLDWLAIELQQSGWSLKDLHRKIVSSRTYRQSSKVRQELTDVDPLNLYLGRQNRLRLDAEIVRDVALVASGLFSPKLGGPPVYPPIPDGVMTLGQQRKTWTASLGDDRYRRGLYTFVYRATPPPSLNVFDAPDGLASCTQRSRSNTPLQALTLLNDLSFFEFAQALQGIIDQDGLEIAFQRCTSRRPTADELALLQTLDPLNAARALLNLDETINRE